MKLERSISTGDTANVTSTMITDGTIVNADISASAEIAVSKLANGSAHQLLQTDTAGTGVEFTSNVDVPGTLDVTGAATFDSTAAVTGALTVTGVINADGKVKFPAGTAGAPSFYNGTDTDTGLYFSAANEISVATGGTQRVVVDSSGRVGIGTASPTNTLHVYSTSNTSARFESSTSASYIRFKDPNGDAFLGNVGNDIAFYTSSSLTERMRIDSSGRLLLGTTTEGEATADNFTIADSGHCGVTLRSGTGSVGTIFFSDGTSGADEYRGYVQYDHSGNYLKWATDATERMRIDSSGRVGIGVTPPDYGSGRVSLDLHSSGATVTHLALTNSTTGSGGASNGFNIIQNGLNTLMYLRESGFMSFSTANTERMRINSSGDITVGPIDISSSTGYGARVDMAANAATISAQCQQTASSFTLLYEGYKGATRNFYVNAAGAAYFQGSVGIGTTSTSSYNAAADNLVIYDSGNAGITIRSGTSSDGAIYFNDTDDANQRGIIRYVHANDALAFHTSAGESLRIDSSGNLNFQQESASSPYPEQKLKWSNDSTTTSGFYISQDTGRNGRVWHEQGLEILFGTSNTEQMRLDVNGRLLLGASSAFDGGSSTLLQALSTGGARIALGRNDTTTAANDSIGRIRWYGNDSDGNYDECARIEVIADADHASNSKPSALTFHTTAESSAQMRIDSSGRLLVGTSSGSGEPIAAFQGRSNDANDSGIRTGTNPSGS